MLRQRILTALIIAPIAIAGVFLLPEVGFAIFVGLVIMVGAWEWANLAGIAGGLRLVYAAGLGALMAGVYLVPPVIILTLGLAWWLIAFYLVLQYPGQVHLWSSKTVRCLIGVFILVPGWVAMLQLKTYPEDSAILILLLFFLIWGADIGAYFSGKAFGKRKLAPAVSPGKSWAGLYGGLVSALLIAIATSLVIEKPELLSLRWALFLVACLFVAMISVLGDLTISMFKRNAGVKDASNLLPGHGGFLDRIDSLLSAGPLFALFVLKYGWT